MMMRINAAGQAYKQVQYFTYLGGVVIETPDMSTEVARRTRASWVRIRRYLRELYDQPKVELSLKTRMVKAEVIEALCMDAVREPFASTLHSLASHNRSSLVGHDVRKNTSLCDCAEIRTHVLTSEGFEVTN